MVERRIDPAGDELAHLRVMHRLEGDVQSHLLRAGDRLAPERELAERFGVARNTLRRALLQLEAQGVLESRGRRGWYVRDGQIVETLDGPHGLTDWATSHGMSIMSRVLGAEGRAATDEEAARLRLPRGAPVFELRRVRLVDGAPLALDRSVLAGRLTPVLEGVDFATVSLYATLREMAQLVPARAEVLLRAIRAEAPVAALLGMVPGEAILELRETVFDQYDEPFETATLLNRGDRYLFRTSLEHGGHEIAGAPNASPRADVASP